MASDRKCIILTSMIHFIHKSLSKPKSSWIVSELIGHYHFRYFHANRCRGNYSRAKLVILPNDLTLSHVELSSSMQFRIKQWSFRSTKCAISSCLSCIIGMAPGSVFNVVILTRRSGIPRIPATRIKKCDKDSVLRDLLPDQQGLSGLSWMINDGDDCSPEFPSCCHSNSQLIRRFHQVWVELPAIEDPKELTKKIKRWFIVQEDLIEMHLVCTCA